MHIYQLSVTMQAHSPVLRTDYNAPDYVIIQLPKGQIRAEHPLLQDVRMFLVFESLVRYNYSIFLMPVKLMEIFETQKLVNVKKD